MKTIALLIILSISASAFAEGTAFKCTSKTKAGDVVTISGCLDVESGNAIKCEGEHSPLITITKRISVSPELLIVKLSGDKVSGYVGEEAFGASLGEQVSEAEDSFQLKYAYKKVNQENYNILKINARGIQNEFKSVNCEMSYME